MTKDNVGETVRLSGWVHRIRDHGGILFIDLRDHYGVTQVLCDPDSPAFAEVEKVRSEWCIRIDGTVKARDESLVNSKLPTGEIEVFVRDIEVLGAAKELPLIVFGDQEYPEETRLRYRYLDLRREEMQRAMTLRSDVVASMRKRMWDLNFREYQTPIITASSPEGARDFLVPSRLHPGKFYALPQAPQLFKQLIMVSGYDKYFQIAPCFRDEDPRADRSPTDFYQLDMEMSFATQEDVFGVIEPVMKGLFEEFADGRTVPDEPFVQIPYFDAIRWYGSDKPDLRNPIRMSDVSDTFRGSGFKVFAGMLDKNPKVEVWAIPARTGGSRAFCDRMNSWAQKEGQPGLGYIFWREENGALEGAGPIAKNIGPERTDAIRTQLGLEAGDAVFFAAGEPSAFASFAGKARDVVGRELDLFEKNVFRFCWIVDFPMYEWDDENKKVEFSHNPFSMPQMDPEAFMALSKDDHETLLGLKAWQYDIVCNGIELSSGAIRNHRPDVMLKAFEFAGYGADVVEEAFGGMLNAFRYGAPPHGGIAPGVDRIVMMLADQENLREVVMFPKDQQARDLMMNAPAPAEMRQLRELHLRTVVPEAKKEG
ncbi:MAG TPA: aspartate--tRNA ligase [Oceanicaulis sp.]|nr:aspartate--tRNA ligase [Oceanicaulis sp.]